MIKRSGNRTLIGMILMMLIASFGAAASARAQAKGGTASPPLRTPAGNDPETRAREMERESLRRKDPHVVMAEISEDLKQLQMIDQQLTDAAASNSAPDYKQTSDMAAEAKKRAARLRTNLVLPPPAKDEKRREFKEPGKEQFDESVAMLKDLIDGFVHNPIFSDAGAVDPQLAAKARRDLDDIIALSEKVRKSADKLRKSSSK